MAMRLCTGLPQPRRFSAAWASMLVALLCLSAVSVSLAAAVGDDPTVEMPGVVSMDEESFDALVGKGKGALVEFYAPWCGHCKAMTGEYAALGAALERSTKAKQSLVIGKVDGTKHRGLVSRFQVSGYPTILYFPPNDAKTPEPYEKGRDAASFISFLSDRIDGLDLVLVQPVQHVLELDAAGFQKHVEENAGVNAFVLFYAPWCGHCKSFKPVFNELARVFAREPRVLIAQINADEPGNRDIATAAKVEGFPTLMMYPTGSRADGPKEYNGMRTLDALVAYINKVAFTRRQANGDVSEMDGLIDLLTPYVHDILDAIRSDDNVAAKRAYERFLENGRGLRGENVHYYMKIAKRLIDDGNVAFVEKETARLGRILAPGGSGAMSGIRRDNMMRRKNILDAVQERRFAEDINERSAEKTRKA